MSDVIKKYQGTLIGLVFILYGMIFFVIMQVFELWADPRDIGPTNFCEYFDPNLLVGEPINAWSNFYYVGAGMLILVYYDIFRMGKVKRKDTYIDRDENLHYIVVYGLLVIWIGLGSFFSTSGFSFAFVGARINEVVGLLSSSTIPRSIIWGLNVIDAGDSWSLVFVFVFFFLMFSKQFRGMQK